MTSEAVPPVDTWLHVSAEAVGPTDEAALDRLRHAPEDPATTGAFMDAFDDVMAAHGLAVDEDYERPLREQYLREGGDPRRIDFYYNLDRCHIVLVVTYGRLVSLLHLDTSLDPYVTDPFSDESFWRAVKDCADRSGCVVTIAPPED